MTLQQLKYAVTVSECGTISAAAEKLFISQPSLTTAIRDLEQELGITIFSRTNRGVIVSREGEEFLGYARQILSQTQLLQERFGARSEGELRFSVSSQHFNFTVLAFARLVRAYPGSPLQPLLSGDHHLRGPLRCEPNAQRNRCPGPE